MQAIRVSAFGGPEVMVPAEVDPPAPGPGELLIAVRAAGVNPVDAYIRSGTYAAKPPLPYTPGLDGAGRVEAVGPGIADFQPGDRVYCGASVTGTYAELALCRHDQVHRLPEGVSYPQGAALGIPYATAFRALHHKGRARAGQRVLIHGASGAVGLAAVQMARARGLTVLATAGSVPGREMVQRQGAHAVFDHYDAGRAERILAAADARGPDLILEMLADVNLALDLELLAPGGKVIVVGNRGCIEINPRLLMAKEASIEGVLLANASPEDMTDIHDGLRSGLLDGTLQPVVARELPLRAAAESHRAVMNSPHRGKIVLIP
jgi:NADPH2:quinone reductase